MFTLYIQNTWVKLKRPISYLQTDNDSVFTSGEFQDFCTAIGVDLKYSSPDTPAENGKAERKWRFIKDGTRVLLTQAARRIGLWTHAMKVFTYSVNRLPSRSNPDWKSPYEMLYGEPPPLKHFRKWGVPCAVTKYYGKTGADFGQKGREGIFLGYAANHAPGSYIVLMTDTNRMVISKHVKFDEGVVLDVLNSANATIGRQAEFTDTSNIDLEGSSVSASGSTEKPKNKPSRGKNPKGTKPGPKRGEHTMKYSKHDIITRTERVSTTPYINSRMDSLDGLAIEEALAKTCPDSRGS